MWCFLNTHSKLLLFLCVLVNSSCRLSPWERQSLSKQRSAWAERVERVRAQVNPDFLKPADFHPKFMLLKTYTWDFEAGAAESCAWHRGGDLRGVGTRQASSMLPVPFFIAPPSLLQPRATRWTLLVPSMAQPSPAPSLLFCSGSFQLVCREHPTDLLLPTSLSL